MQFLKNIASSKAAYLGNLGKKQKYIDINFFKSYFFKKITEKKKPKEKYHYTIAFAYLIRISEIGQGFNYHPIF